MDALFDIMIASIAFASLGVGIWNTIKIREVHLVMNNRLDQLLMISTTASYTAGVETSRALRQALNELQHITDRMK